MTRTFKAWLVGFLAIALFTPISVLWLDRPIALFVHDMFGSRQIVGDLGRSHVLSISLISALIFLICGISAIMGRRFSKWGTTVLLCDISALAVFATKDELKFFFGRTWPDSWGPNTMSLIRDNAYGFHFFHPGKSFESFPSGHASVIAAVMSVLWILHPRLRGLWALCVIAADIALVAVNIHFLSDVVAGSFVGVSTGLFTVAVWRAADHRNAERGRGLSSSGQLLAARNQPAPRVKGDDAASDANIVQPPLMKDFSETTAVVDMAIESDTRQVH
jgi:membrane-associated phospholipid phosphatase